MTEAPFVRRALWHDALVDHLARRAPDTETAQVIADRHRRLIDTYDAAASGHTEA
jgi:myo-inositol catabolism protein IolC